MTPLVSLVAQSVYFAVKPYLHKRVKFLIDRLGANPNISVFKAYGVCSEKETALSIAIRQYNNYNRRDRFREDSSFFKETINSSILLYKETIKSLIRRSGIISSEIFLESYVITERELVETLKQIKAEIDLEDFTTAKVLMESSSLCRSTAIMIAQYYNDTYEDLADN